MWRLIYASRKLKAQEKQLLEHALDGLCFSCRFLLQDAELPEGLQVFVRSMNCGEPIEAFLSVMTAVRSPRFPAEVLRRSDC